MAFSMCQSAVHSVCVQLTSSSAKLGFTFLLLFIHEHGEDTYLLPEWFTENRLGAEDGRTGYGAIRVTED